MKYLLPLLILINCHEIKGVLEWTVVGKVTDYGQNVTLFCHVPNCCPKDAGWDRWTPNQRTLFIDVKTGRHNKKYDGKVEKDGYTLVIQNLTKNDLNVSYSCLYGVTLGEQKYLLGEDVFTYMSTTQPNVNNSQVAGIIVGVIVLVAVALSAGLLVFHFHPKIKKRNSRGLESNKKQSSRESIQLIGNDDDIRVDPMSCETGYGKDILMQLEEEKRKNMILEEMNSGTEIRRYVRIHVVGKEGVGKTSLVRKLLGKDFLQNIDSTDGLDINIAWQISTRSGEWTASTVETEKKKMGKRILHAVNMQHKNNSKSHVKPIPSKKNEVKTQWNPSSQKFKTSADHLLPTENEESETNDANENESFLPKKREDSPTSNVKVISEKNDDDLATKYTKRHNREDVPRDEIPGDSKIKKTNEKKQNYDEKPDFTTLSPIDSVKTDQIVDELINMLNDPTNEEDIKTSDGLVECRIWDFAGQKDYYATHQTFFTPHAIYLLVVDVNEKIQAGTYTEILNFETSGEYVDFWFESIHCFCENPSLTKLCPPVIIVCTGTDKLEEKLTKEQVEKWIKDFNDDLKTIIGKQNKYNHSRDIFFISNKTSSETEIEKLRKHISKVAEEMRYFAKKLPTRWIKLENELDVLKVTGEPILSWHNMQKLAKTNSIQEDELIGFLNFQHKIGNIIFFKDICENIILEPNWLVRCFRCLICDDEKKHYPLSLPTERVKLEQSGELSNALLNELFEKESDLHFAHYKKHILNVMTKFDIIINVNNTYYMPCMIKKSSDLNEIKEDFGVENSNCTPWLILEFNFLPIAFYNHIMLSFITKYKVCEVNSRNKALDGHPAIYNGKTVVSLDGTKFRLLIICFSRNVIALQIWKWKDIKPDKYTDILKELCIEIENLERTLETNLYYEIKAKCSTGNYTAKSDRLSYRQLREQCDGEIYKCAEHNADHNRKDLENIWLKNADSIQQEIKQMGKKEAEQKPVIKNEFEQKPVTKKETKLKGTKSKTSRFFRNKQRDTDKPNINLPETEPLTNTDKHIEEWAKEVAAEMLLNQNEEHTDLKEKMIQIETEQEKLKQKNKKDNEGLSDLKEKVVKLENKQTEVIPENIRDKMKIQITDWEEKDKMFVTTRASEYIMTCLKKNSCLTITAPSGVGKSFIARHSALVLQKGGYTIIPVGKPDDIRDYYQPGKHAVFIVDDICGNFTANQHQIENWQQLLPVINTVIADKCCKIIVSCRLQVYKDDKFNILEPFKSCECNLMSDKLGLTAEEKDIMASMYIDSSFDNIDKLSQNSEFFPLLCSLYLREKHGDVKEFFKNPFFVYQTELDSLGRHGDEGNYKICSLALLVLFNNQLKDKWIQGTVRRDQQQLIETTCDACGLNRGTSKAKLKEALLTLEGTFVHKQDGIYRTVHDKLFDFIAHYFGQKMIECLIDHADSDFVHERFIWRNSTDGGKSNIDFIIQIPDENFELYLERFIKDWSTGKVRVTFRNTNLRVSEFRQQLLKHLQNLNKSLQVTLANKCDTVLSKEHHGSGTTPLIQTCFYCHTDMVQWMLHNDVVVNQHRDDGVTGLLVASENGHTDIVKLLLEKNPNIDLCQNTGCSPLLMASFKGHTVIVKLLLDRSPNTDLCNNSGSSPLFMASQEGHTEIVKLLLERNPNIDLCNRHGCSPLCIASQNGHTEIVKLLLERNPKIDLCSKRTGCSPLYYASKHGYVEIVKLLLEKNPNVDLCDNNGCSPLRQACQNGHTDIVKLLLEKSPNIDLCDNKYGCSPLYMASQEGHTEIVKLLLEKSPDVDICDNDGCSPLHMASQIGHTVIVKLLLEKNPSIDLCDEDGCSPLYMASQNGNTEIVKLLLEKNPNIDLCDKDGCSPLEKASQNGHTDIIRLLSEKKSKC